MNDEEKKQLYESRFQVPEPKVDTAKDLIDFLRLSNPIWKTYSEGDEYSSHSPMWDDEWNRDWYFRGQGVDVSFRDGKIEWGLMPSAWRDNSLIKLAVKAEGNNNLIKSAIQNIKVKLHIENENVDNLNWDRVKSASLQILSEINVVRDFLEFADTIGYTYPSIVHKISAIAIVDALARKKKEFFVSLWNNPSFALAQHHGMPTRILDWTRNPLVAAYFAAYSSLLENEKSQLARPPAFVVYAIHKSWLNTTNTDCWVSEIKIKQSENIFSRHQYGVSLVNPTGDISYIETGAYPDFTETIFGFESDLNEKFKPYKITLSHDKALELIRLLNLEKTTKAHLMPSLDSVAEVIKMQWRYNLEKKR